MMRNRTILTIGCLLCLAAPSFAKQRKVGLNVKVTTHSAALTMTNPTEPVQSAVTNNVYRCAGAGCSNFGTAIATGVSGSAFTDTTVVAGTTYVYQVTAVCPTTGVGCGTTQAPVQGEGPASNQVTANIPNNPVTPGAPVLNPPVVN